MTPADLFNEFLKLDETQRDNSLRCLFLHTLLHLLDGNYLVLTKHEYGKILR